MITQHITEEQFINEFEAIRPNNFSIVGLCALYEWLENMSEDMDKPYELDVIAICCEFTEYDSLDAIQDYYGDIMTIDDLNCNTLVIDLGDNGGYILQDY
tara:strand:+ start:69 stop:368 length:300 start_codon:yes stop_codon:yes gene_type:complete